VGIYWVIFYFDLNKTDTQKQDPLVNKKKVPMGQQKRTGPSGQNKSLRAAINKKV
jgi:hypothetical protein